MNRTTLAALCLLATSLHAQAQDPAANSVAPQVVPPAAGRNTVAVVVGLSSYANLPDEVELDFARSEAAIIAKKLREEAHFTHVFQMTDGEATRDAVRQKLRNEVAQLLGPNDLFVLYFVGHGIGADLGLPVLLTYDSTMENGQEDGLELQAFARDLQTWTRAGTTLIVTDVIHRNQLDGIYFYGPAANHWPTMPRGTMIISASQADSPGTDGAFGQVFADAIVGAADSNGDTFVTPQELAGYLSNRMEPAGQIPVIAGDFLPNAVLSAGVSGKAGGGIEGAPIPGEEAVYPDTDIWSAKFVYREGDAQSVQCREQELTACSPSCYVRSFKAGPCNLKAIIDGVEMQGKVIVLWPGKYDCGRKAGDLVCTPPKNTSPQRPE